MYGECPWSGGAQMCWGLQSSSSAAWGISNARSGSPGGLVATSRASADGGSMYPVDIMLGGSDDVGVVCDTAELSGTALEKKIPPVPLFNG